MTHIKEEPLLSEDDEYWENIDVNDCNYLLRTLGKSFFIGNFFLLLNMITMNYDSRYYYIFIFEGNIFQSVKRIRL